MAAAEERFLLGAGAGLGALIHLRKDDRDLLSVEFMGREALTTSAIEGEMLDRDSVQSSIQHHLGLPGDRHRVPPAEAGIAEMTVDRYRSTSEPLSEEMLFRWHRMLTLGRRDLNDVGRYRTSLDPMQIISGPFGAQRVHFEAPAASRVPLEMKWYIDWFNRTVPSAKEPLPALTRAGIAHLYFESIHPFEDGNGRIGRALAEKALAQGAGQPTITGLATEILARRKSYYDALAEANRRIEITGWLEWFATVTLSAQQHTLEKVEFLIAKTRLLDRMRGQLNVRQEKALLRMLEEGPGGFKGGLSAGNYSTITGAPPATTTRDLADMVEKGALIRTGERKSTRYQVNLPALE